MGKALIFRKPKAQKSKTQVMSAHPILLVASCCLLLICCCAEGNEKIQASVNGRWELVKGFRNQKETETLQGVFFEFSAEGRMTTNLPVGAESPIEFELRKNEIHQKSPYPVVYTIQSATDSTLVLAMEMRGVQFELQLKKALPPVPQDSLFQPADSLSE